MNEGKIERLRESISDAVARHGRQRAECERRRAEPPRPGDVYAFAATAEFSVLWTILEEDPDDGRLVAVAMDLLPLVGSADVRVPDGSAFAASVLRPRFEVRLAPEDVRIARRGGSLENEVLERVRRKRSQLANAALTGTEIDQEIEAESDYQDRSREVEQARQELLQALERRRADTGRALDTGQVLAFPQTPRTRFPTSGSGAWAVAASLLLAVALPILWLQRLEIVRLNEKAAGAAGRFENSAVEWLYPAEDERGETDRPRLRVPASSALVVLVLQIPESPAFPVYRLEIVERSEGTVLPSEEGLVPFQPGKLSVTWPRDRLPSGDYRLALYGGRTTEEPVAEYGLILVRE